VEVGCKHAAGGGGEGCVRGGVRPRERASESGRELGFCLVQQVIYYGNTVKADNSWAIWAEMGFFHSLSA
jgi:hypothetical protein